MFDYEVKIAQNKNEFEQALRLRYEVFIQEMGRDANQSKIALLDIDDYDKLSDHLVVIDKTKNKVVGTYRLLLGYKIAPIRKIYPDEMELSGKLNTKLGFYSEKFFNIENIKKLAGDEEMLELGRSCIHRDYRDRLVINLLWSGISKYIKDHNVRFVFGSVTLGNSDAISAVEVSRVFKLIKKKFYAHQAYRVYPKEAFIFKGLNKNVKVEDYQDIWRSLPPLVKGYLRAGVVVCGPPAVNPAFGSILLFILLDIKNMSAAYKRHFF
jgi:putative hemolysin